MDLFIFFALNSNANEPSGVNVESEQAKWLKQTLVSSKEQYNIVYFHHPPYSSGTVHGSTIYMQWPFKEWGADLVLSGHEHTYERLAENGLTYVVNGLGGYPARYSFGKPIQGSAFRYNDNYGTLCVNVTQSRLKADFLNVDNQEIDTFTLKPKNSD